MTETRATKAKAEWKTPELLIDPNSLKTIEGLVNDGTDAGTFSSS